MNYEWDAAKNITNQIKHGISFEEARLIFEGDVLTGVDGRLDYGETRYMSIGAILGLIVIAVIHTDRDGTTRIISARLANRSERQKYHDHLGRSS
ncbi:BrnT family toxin [Agrobacterium sp. MA01]|uniref:BrnT family toxin n=1 Tax=Agrobacterium sp. MA01 TaxID=2664893 RepID=UPI00129B1278|nr:BrnT family toxin [Agrobacterium sp. MA01]QGG90190.1 BrnT family toxin [Agrobacterium sp. MA01]